MEHNTQKSPDPRRTLARDFVRYILFTRHEPWLKTNFV